MLDFKNKLVKAIVDNFINYNVNPNPINDGKIIEFDEKNQIHHINSIESKSNLNVAVSKNLETKEQLQKAEEIIKHYQDKKLSFTWCVISDSPEEKNREFFQEKGFTHSETMIAMVMDLDNFNNQAELEETEKFNQIETSEDNEKFIDVIKKTFSLVLIDLEKYYGLHQMRNNEKDIDYSVYFSVDGVPASTGHFYFEDEYVFIDDIATSPDFQKRGFGKKMLLHLLETAKNMGYKQATLVATPKGFPLYEKLGFQALNLYFHVYALNYAVI